LGGVAFSGRRQELGVSLVPAAATRLALSCPARTFYSALMATQPSACALLFRQPWKATEAVVRPRAARGRGREAAFSKGGGKDGEEGRYCEGSRLRR
jgi:hypothetical protein